MDGVDGGTVGSVGTSVTKVVSDVAGLAPPPVPVTTDDEPPPDPGLEDGDDGEDDEDVDLLMTRLELTLKEGVDGGMVGSVMTPVTTVVRGPVGGLAPLPTPVAADVVDVLCLSNGDLSFRLLAIRQTREGLT